MGWVLNIGDKPVRMDDMQISAIAKIAERHGTSWFTLTTTGPASNPDAFFDLLRYAAEQVEEPPPDHDGTVRSMRALLALIEWEPDDLPAGWEDGNPTEGETTTP